MGQRSGPGLRNGFALRRMRPALSVAVSPARLVVCVSELDGRGFLGLAVPGYRHALQPGGTAAAGLHVRTPLHLMRAI